MITRDRIADLDTMVYVEATHPAEIYGCGVRTIHRRMADNGHKLIEIGRKHFFLARDLKKILEDKPVGSNSHSPRKN